MGVYDPHHVFDKYSAMRFEATWISWNAYSKESKRWLSNLRATVSQGRIPVLNIEPWPVAAISGEKNLLPSIAAGKYDQLITKIATDIKPLGTVYVRWGAEMEFTKQFPWARKPAQDYIAAYRHFVELFRQTAPESVMIWSPVGNKECRAYYPGNDVVDYVGFSVYEAPVASAKWFGHAMSFAQWMDIKYQNVQCFNKQILIPELGVEGTPAFQRAWLQAAFATIPSHLLLTGIIYYESQDFHSWKDLGLKGAPVWTVDPALFK